MAYGGSAFRSFDSRLGARQEAARRAAEERQKAQGTEAAGVLQTGGTLLGALIGGIAAPFTAGASIPVGMAAGAGIGSALGGLGAAAVSPETVDVSKTLPGGLSALDKLLGLGEEESPGKDGLPKPKKKSSGPFDLSFGR